MSISLEVWGDYALFTRPEMKVERVSYDMMTPSAARGLIEAIYWHPGMKWVIDGDTVPPQLAEQGTTSLPRPQPLDQRCAFPCGDIDGAGILLNEAEPLRHGAEGE